MTVKRPLGHGRGRRAWLLAALSLALIAVSQNSSWAALVTRVAVEASGRGAALAILSTAPEALDLQSFTLDDPPRLVFDIPGAVLAQGQAECLPVGAAGIRQVRVAQHQSDPGLVRLVLDLEVASPPAWRRAPGRQAGEALILIGEPVPLALQPPTVKAVGDTVLVRIPDAAGLTRCVATLEAPPRVYADLTGAVLEAVYVQGYEEGLVRQVRMAQQTLTCDPPVSRVVVELREPTEHVLYQDGSDLVIALGPQPWAAPLPPYQAAGRLKGKRIVVDPGHGGGRSGAPAIKGPPAEPPYEKDMVLDIGLRLRRLLGSEGAEVAMTREDDTNVSLRRRADLANELKADAFVSIHCNSYPTPDTLSGTSVYYDHGNSVELAELVQQELVAGLGTKDKGARSANFSVIRRTQGPGILVETAYINHEGDRARLLNPNFRERAARAILHGVIRFLCQNAQASASEG